MEDILLINELRPAASADSVRRRVVDERTAATLLGVSLVHLRRLRRAHLGPRHVKLGERRIGYKIGDIDDWLDSRTFSDVYGSLSCA